MLSIFLVYSFWLFGHLLWNLLIDSLPNTLQKHLFLPSDISGFVASPELSPSHRKMIASLLMEMIAFTSHFCWLTESRSYSEAKQPWISAQHPSLTTDKTLSVTYHMSFTRCSVPCNTVVWLVGWEGIAVFYATKRFVPVHKHVAVVLSELHDTSRRYESPTEY